VADRKISDLTALTTPATGDLIPIVDISEAAAADKNKSITVGELLRGAPDGTEAAPGFAFESAGGNGMFQPTTGVVSFSTGGSQRVRIDASGRVMIGTTTEGQANADNLTVVDSGSCGITIRSASDNFGRIYFSDGTSGDDEYRGIVQYDHSDNRFQIATNASVAMSIDSSQRVGIGTTSPSNQLHVKNSATDGTGTDNCDIIVESVNRNAALNVRAKSTNSSSIFFGDGDSASRGRIVYEHSTDGLLFGTSDSGENVRVDSSGRLLVGTTSSASSNAAAAVEIIGNTTTGGMLTVGRNDTVISVNNSIGFINFVGNDADGGYDQCASINCAADGSHGDTSKPSRLVFSTTASSNISPTERLRITASGDVTTTGASTFSRTNAGFTARNGDSVSITRTTGTPLEVNRQGSDGTIVAFYESNSAEGSITISGTTTSYNGAHLARWSQLPGGIERTEILRGSVLSNIDEMCEWGEEENEQLNRMKVSDVEGDKNVSGVFQAWDDDDDTYTNDFYCAMTGDFVIRIAQGVTVERGDLLMSAGDGTAKPQDDDIIRSKTIAKVTSTNVSCTYDDGSYCVPCVLMAC